MQEVPTEANNKPEPQLIVGSRVYLQVPDNFKIGDNFIGIRHIDEDAFVMISEVPSSYLEFSKQYDDDQLLKQDMVIKERRRIENDGLSGERITVEYDNRGKVYIRQIFITGDSRESIVIAGAYPKSRKKALAPIITNTIDTALWDSSRALDLFDGLDYRIDDVPGLRLATRVNESLVFTQNGRLPDQYYTEALLIMSLKEVPENATLRGSFAQDQFNNITLLHNHQVTRVIDDSLIGLNSVIVEGTGTHRHLGYKVAAIQIILQTDVGFLVAQGFSTAEKQEQDFHMFRTTVSSFRVQDHAR